MLVFFSLINCRIIAKAIHADMLSIFFEVQMTLMIFCFIAQIYRRFAKICQPEKEGTGKADGTQNSTWTSGRRRRVQRERRVCDLGLQKEIVGDAGRGGSWEKRSRDGR